MQKKFRKRLIFGTFCDKIYLGGDEMITSNISINLLDVLLYRQSAAKTINKGRSYSALSFRTDSKSEFFIDGRRLPADTGSIAFVPGGIEYERVTKHEEAIVFHFEMFGALDESIEVFCTKHPDEYKLLFSQALDIWEKKEPGFKYKATAVFYDILAKLQSDGEIAEVSAIKSSERTAVGAKEIIDLHFSDANIGISEIADKLFVSESYLRRVFEGKFSMSPKKYLDNVRIAHARSLIDSGIFNQKEIARRCGFEDVKYFRTVFQKKMGISPSEYKYSFGDKK